MSDLTEFLLARIAEDEAVARAATTGPWQWWESKDHGPDSDWTDQGPRLETVARGPVYSDGSQGAATTVINGWGHDAWGLDVELADMEYIARWDPSRVLAECEAKRRMVEQASDVEWGGYAVRDAILGALSRVYADHPEYREEWKL